jgi:hypothetical protein
LRFHTEGAEPQRFVAELGEVAQRALLARCRLRWSSRPSRPCWWRGLDADRANASIRHRVGGLSTGLAIFELGFVGTGRILPAARSGSRWSAGRPARSRLESLARLPFA